MDSTATARLIFDVSSLRSGVRDAQQSLGTLYEVVRDNWWGIRNVGLAWQNAGLLIAGGVGVAVKAAADFEQGMAGVARTTYDASQSAEQNAKNVALLSEELQKVAATRPVDLKTITQIAEDAGSLGIASKDVAEFTATITDLVATTNLTADSAPKLARVASIFGLTADQYKNLGSAIFESGRSVAATESEVLNMTTRLAGAGKAAGLTADQVVALSAATLSLGPKAEAGASALQRTLGNLAKAAADADPTQLQAFATVAGTTASEFKQLIANNPAQALASFVEGLGRANTNAINATGVLNALGITEVRQVQALEALAAGTQNTSNENVNLANTLKLSKDAFDKGTAVTDAAAAQYGTLSNQLKILRNNVNEIFLSYGTLYLPVVKDAVAVTQDFAVGLGALPAPLKAVAATIGAATGSALLLGAGFLLIGPRIILARDAFTKLTTAMRVSLGTSLALQGAQDATGAAGLRAAFSAGLNARKQAELATAQGAAAAAAQLETEAEAANAQAKLANYRITQLQDIASRQLAAGKVEEAAATEAQIVVLRAEALAYENAARAATANAAAQQLSTTAMGAGRTAALGLGAAVRFLTGPVGIIITLLGAAAAAIAAFGGEAKKASAIAEEYKQANESLAQAIIQDARAHDGAVRAFLQEQLAMSGAIAMADRYNISLQELFAVIEGSDPAAATDFANKIGDAYRAGDTDAVTLGNTVQKLNKIYVASAAAARDMVRGQQSATKADKEGAVAAEDLAAKQQTAIQAMKSRAQAAMALLDAQFSQREAEFAVADALKTYNDALDASKRKAEEVAKAEMALERAKLDAARSDRELAKAEDALRTARTRQAEATKQAELDAADAKYRYLDAVDRVAEAEKTLQEVQAGPTAKELRDATNKLADARLSLTSATKKASDAEWYLTYLQGEGASTRDIQDAQDALAQARQDVADKTAAQTDAEAELKKLQDGVDPEKVAKAERDLAEARLSAERAARAQQQAEQDLAQARKDQANDTMYKDAESDLSDARLRSADAAQAIKDAEKALDDARKGNTATEDVKKAELALEEAYYRQAQAIAAVEKARAEAAGKEFTARDEAIALEKALRKVGATASGTVKQQILDYANTLRDNIPPAVNTKITITPPSPNLSDIPIGELKIPVPSVTDALKPFAEDTRGFFEKLWDWIAEHWLEALLGTLAGIGVAIVGFFAGIPTLIIGALSIAVAAVATWLLSIIPDSWGQAMSDAFNTSLAWMSNIPGWIADFFTQILPDAAEAAAEWIGSIATSMWDKFTGTGDDTWDFVTWLSERLVAWLSGAQANFGQWLGELVNWGWQQVVDAATSGWDFLGLLGQLIAGWASSAATSVGDFATDLASRLWESFTSGLTSFGAGLVQFWMDLLGPLYGVTQSVFGDLVEWIKAPINQVISGVNWVLSSLASMSFTAPDWVPGIGGQTVGFPSFQIPYLAQGGLTTGPTVAMIGEAGTEAVIPLDKLYRMFDPVLDMVRELQTMNEMLRTTFANNGVGGAVSNTSVVNHGDHNEFNIYEKTDPQEIARELVWAKVK